VERLEPLREKLKDEFLPAKEKADLVAEIKRLEASSDLLKNLYHEVTPKDLDAYELKKLKEAAQQPSSEEEESESSDDSDEGESPAKGKEDEEGENAAAPSKP
jgi:hypothetical protein